MKKPVNDALVAEYAKRLRSGGPLGQVFPHAVSECEFTDAQSLMIKEARKVRDTLQKKSQPQPAVPPAALKATTVAKPAGPAQPPTKKPQSMGKLEKMLYLQQNKCFFCGEKLALADASIEHLNPISLGGLRTEDNEVICHKSLNHTFGNLSLKRKFEFVLKTSGSFQCP